MSLLEQLPNELFANVAGSLDCGTICSLRLVSREISSKTNQDVIVAPYFRVARVNLTIEGLKSFKSATSGIVGRYIEQLTLIGIAYDYHSLAQILVDGGRRCSRPGQFQSRLVKYTAGQLSQVQQDHDSLRRMDEDHLPSIQNLELPLRLLKSFKNISARSTQHCIKSVSLEMRVVADPNADPSLVQDASDHIDSRGQMMTVAGGTLALVLAMLKVSELKDVHALHIYTSAPASLGCSLPVDIMFDVLQESFMTNLTPLYSLKNVRQLSISFTDPFFAAGANHRRDVEAALVGNDRVFALTGLLRAFPNVQELHIGRSSPMWRGPMADGVRAYCRQTVSALFIQHMTKHVKLPNLHKFRFGGFEVQVADLANLLIAFGGAIKHIELVALDVRGDLSTALAPLTTASCTTLESIAMEAISVDGRLIEGNRAHDQAYPTITGDGTSRWTVIRRVGQAARKPIDYSFAHATPWTFQEGLYEQAIKDEYQWSGTI